ncbi:hypothetical protein OPS25_08695 [Alteromonas ponticola]|uniref:GtrA-like protein domain-containing protein n=1 Tax=Alteromonas aquimaris TaxID=2998417 RepID=A0ABT3P733_9ALTE|nr:hypothetical protein [Alteromonas aquimaris]MCW8108573.1 hypothetical protein [Alteromonas aquimaris]
MSKFEKFLLIFLVSTIGLLGFYGFNQSFIYFGYFDKYDTVFGVVVASLISYLLFRYQFFVWLPKNKEVKYKKKLVASIFVVFIYCPLFSFFYAHKALNSGVGLLLTHLYGIAKPDKEVLMTVKYSKSVRTWCTKYLVSEEFNNGIFNELKLCIEANEFSSITTRARVRLSVKESKFGLYVSTWRIDGV